MHKIGIMIVSISLDKDQVMRFNGTCFSSI